MKHARLTLLLCAFGSIVCVAAPIDGKWTAQVQARQGTQTQTLTLKSSGATLTGGLDMGRGAFDIIEGKITGSDVSFKMRLQGNGLSVWAAVKNKENSWLSTTRA